jgi:hypothetical protein
MTRPIIVHSLAHAQAAAEAASALGVDLVLWSAEGAGGAAGVGWFAGLAEAVRQDYPGASIAFVIDCADEAGTAMAALHLGLRRLRFSGDPAVAVKLVGLGAELEAQADEVLDLGDIRAVPEACRNWLAAAADRR